MRMDMQATPPRSAARRPPVVPGRRRFLVLEFNELCPSLLARWMGDGTLPNFKRLHARSDAFVSVADAPEGPHLEPWIQWYSAHTGLAFDQHGVFHLTDGARAGHEDIFRVLLGAGRRVASFGSMNVTPFRAEGSVFLPDPWSDDGITWPDALAGFTAFVSRQVREYTNDGGRGRVLEAARFLRFMLGHGLHPATIAALLGQLAMERIVEPRLSYRRAVLLDRLQFDLFRHVFLKAPPDFATFFLNSTAHLQHAFWRHHEPEAFILRPGPEELAVYGDAMRFGYRSMDRLVGRFMDLADRTGAMLVFMTALSQQPFLKHEARGGQHFHRLRDASAFLASLSIRPRELRPTMTHQYLARFDDAAAAARARAVLDAVTLGDGRGVFDFAASEPDSLYFGCDITTPPGPDAVIRFADDRTPVPFDRAFYRIDGIKSGRHHPDGALWFDTGAGRAHGGRVSILDVFPTLLELMDVPLPARGQRRGVSLVPRMAGAGTGRPPVAAVA